MSEIKDISVLESESLKEIKNYSDSQFKVIVDLQKKISKLESENQSLKLMLEQNTPNLISVGDLGFGISNEQIICETQIVILKDAAVTRPLTMEEVRKLEVLTKVLDQVKKKDPDFESLNARNMTTEELISIAQNVST